MPGFSKKPPQAPKADMAALLKSHNEMRAKLGLSSLNSTLPLWKRYVESVEEYDASGLRDTINANAYALDSLKDDHDALDARESAHYGNLNSRLTALENVPKLPSQAPQVGASGSTKSSTQDFSPPISLRPKPKLPDTAG